MLEERCEDNGLRLVLGGEILAGGRLPLQQRLGSQEIPVDEGVDFLFGHYGFNPVGGWIRCLLHHHLLDF